MHASCPLLFRQIDGTVARINALPVSLLIVAYLATGQIWLLYIVAADFLIRIYLPKYFSPVFQISTLIKYLFHMQTVMADAGAKRVAAFMGLFMVVAMILLGHTGLVSISFAVGVLFMLCTMMEIFFSYCIGCHLYHIYKKWVRV